MKENEIFLKQGLRFIQNKSMVADCPDQKEFLHVGTHPLPLLSIYLVKKYQKYQKMAKKWAQNWIRKSLPLTSTLVEYIFLWKIWGKEENQRENILDDQSHEPSRGKNHPSYFLPLQLNYINTPTPPSFSSISTHLLCWDNASSLSKVLMQGTSTSMTSQTLKDLSSFNGKLTSSCQPKP